MALVYHNITPPEYFVGVHKDLVKQCFRGRRELTAYIDRCELALGDSEYNRQELEALGFPRTGVLPVVPGLHPPRRSARIALLAGDFDDEWTNVMFVGRVIPNKKIEDVIRAFHVYRTRHNPRVAAAAGRLLQRLRDATWRCCTRSIAQARHARRALPRPRLERGADGALRRRRPVPVRQRARRLLRADRRGVLQAGAGAGLCRDRRAGDDGRRRRAVRHQGSRSRSRG